MKKNEDPLATILKTVSPHHVNRGRAAGGGAAIGAVLGSLLGGPVGAAIGAAVGGAAGVAISEKPGR